MNRQDLINTIRQSIIKVLKHDNFEIHDELTVADVEGWDSLSHMLIITEIEKAFTVKFKLKELNKLKNMGSLIELIESKL